MTFVRNSSWMIAVNLVDTVKNYVPFLIAYLIFQPGNTGWIAIAGNVFLGLVIVLATHSLLTDWVTQFYAFDEEGIRHRRGLLSKVETYLRWSSVTAIEVRRDPVRTLGGCCKVVVLASADQVVVLDTVPLSLVDKIQRVSGLPITQTASSKMPSQAASNETPSQPAEVAVDTLVPARPRAPASEPVFVATIRDLVFMSLAYGKFALFVPAAFGAFAELEGAGLLPDFGLAVDSVMAMGIPAKVALIALLIFIALAYGCAVALIRFWGFRVSADGGSLVLEGGLLTSQRRTISLDSVAGFALRRNLFDLLTGRGRLALLTRDAGQTLGKNVVFPALRMSEIGTRIDKICPDAGKFLALDHATPRLGRIWFVLGASVLFTIVLAVGVLSVFGLWRYYLIALAVVFIVSVWDVAGYFRTLTFDQDTGRVLYRRGLVWRSMLSVPLSEVCVSRIDAGLLERWPGIKWVTLYYFSSGRARKIVAWQRSTDCEVDWLKLAAHGKGGRIDGKDQL